MALIGGGPESFIGPIHRMAAELDGRISLVAGAFSSDIARSRAAARTYCLPEDRAYGGFEAMIAAESARPDGARIVAIAAPNHVHFPAAKIALEAGMAVISDKPATATLEEAIALSETVARTGSLYVLTYTYTGYAMIREARSMVESGALGKIRKVVVEYSQGWLAQPAERNGSKQAKWRTEPEQAGLGGCVGDIGVHAFNAMEFVSGLRVARLCAHLSAVVSGRKLDDDCNILLELDGGVPGVLHASQIAAGARNGMRVRVWGEEGGLDWSHETPDRLTIDWRKGATEIRHAGSEGLSATALAASRLPPGHPEGFIEAFATLYRDFADRIVDPSGDGGALLPSIDEGVRGMAFIDRAVASSRARRWLEISV